MWMLRHVIGAPLGVAFLTLLTHSLAVGGECPDVQYGGSLTIGGPGLDVSTAVATDSTGNRFIGGAFHDTVDFDPTEGIDLHSAAGNCGVFVTKLNADGTYAWTRTFGGTSCDSIRSVAVDPDNNIVIVGYFWETADFDPGEGVDEHSTNGERDVFVTKFLADGSYGWTRTFGGECAEEAWDVVIDQEGNVFVAGFFHDLVDFDPTEGGEDEHLSAGDDDVFVTKFTGNGDFVWAQTFGGPDEDNVIQIAVSGGGSLFLTGHFEGTSDFDPSDEGVSEHTSNGGVDIFITKLGVDGSYEWTATIGGEDFDGGHAVAVDLDGNVVFTGFFLSTGSVDFDPTDGVDERSSNGAADIFATKLTSDGAYLWTWTAGDSENELAEGIAIDVDGAVFITGGFGDPGAPPGYTLDFDSGGEGDEHSSEGEKDAFITHLNADGSYGWTRTFGGLSWDYGLDLALDQDSNISVVGFYYASADLDPTAGIDIHESLGESDIFITTLLCTDELPCEGDANGDGLVDPLDSGFVLARFGCDVGTGDPNCDLADMNGDGLVDPLDVGFILARFGPCG